MERHNNNRPISPSNLNSSTCDLGSFKSTTLDMRLWTEMKPVRTERESNSRNSSLQRKKQHHNVGNGGSLRRGPYVPCSNEELDAEAADGKDSKIFPKEHYKASKKHSLSRKRNSMVDG